MERRAFLTTLAVGTVGVAGCLGGGSAQSSSGGSGDSGSSSEYDGWFDNVSNYDGTVDRTGQDEVTVKVGTQANGGGNGFGPAAVEVTAGTTVVWKWTGAGGTHNVVAEDGSFQSDYATKQGATFEHTFAETGTYTYYCKPHLGMGMKGAVRVVE
ncbi:halocyanin domain-containing protein [Halogranum amylolyticum]|uniref:Halocyanin domain-containing protein n=1 Tax=Halogranum amylolyticum TaxID=660520 RepID=A0A1H8PSK8_9EURY|nr:halocyanin domain-containing protein [Halogranum amylolyticum]SEO44674.1 halocyanin domain-containing protein [Halogranum amylolyticum]